MNRRERREKGREASGVVELVVCQEVELELLNVKVVDRALVRV